ncbi:MAG TPA: sigma-54 dependent transcriptional regulator [Pyrinomonadaceae bacterium]
MRPEKLLLLDLGPAWGAGEQLRAMLETTFQVKVLPLDDEHEGRKSETLCDVVEAVRGCEPSLIFLVLPRTETKRTSPLLQTIFAELNDLPVVVVTETEEPGELFELLRQGVADFVTPPLRAVDLFPRIWHALEQTRREEPWVRKLKEKLGLKQLIGESPAFLAEVQKFPIVARCDASVLISGETGTGKEVCARAIHYLSPRSAKAFVPVNCGAIPLELVENELFGHERGAYTGASSAQPGLIQEAAGGTLFLDEIDSLPLPAQVKLLRFLQEKEYRPLGSTRICKADVRVIAASNQDFEAAVKEGKLRRDLYYRLNVMPLVLPPLRERPEDISLLARHFVNKYAAEFNKEVKHLSPGALRRLQLYDWPGNVRELEHTVERAVMLCEHDTVQAAEIMLPTNEEPARAESFREAKARLVARFEKEYIQKLLLSHQGNITKAAETARKDRRAFWQLIRKHRIDVKSFRAAAH